MSSKVLTKYFFNEEIKLGATKAEPLFYLYKKNQLSQMSLSSPYRETCSRRIASRSPSASPTKRLQLYGVLVRLQPFDRRFWSRCPWVTLSLLQ
jgi:hypothetical protein